MIGNSPSFFKDPHAIADIPTDSPLLLAFSGGADSSALLHLLCKLRDKRSFRLYAAHVNHSIRTEEYGNEALRDEEFCKRLCKKLDVELFVARLDVPAIAKESGQSLETAARDARYAFFAKVMKANGIGTLVTAHNADDNLETQIFNLCRGCGIDGICGIPETRSFDAVAGGEIVRPILSASKQEILDFCKENGIEYVTDSTNLETDCTRNKIRHNILPQLRALFNSPEKAGLRLSQTANEDSDFIKREAEGALADERDSISLSLLNSLHPAVAKRVLRTLFENSSGQKLESIHTEEILRLAKANKNGKLSLPCKTTAIFSGGRLSFVPEAEIKSVPIRYSLPLTEALTVIGGTDFAILRTESREPPKSIIIDENCYSLYSYACLQVNDPSILRAENRREGDLILVGGMHKKLKKLMCDKKIPQELRVSLPLIKLDEAVLYAPKCAVSDCAKPQNGINTHTIAIYYKK